MSILSIQSHVAYGYVGNKAATFPLQSMGYDVWPVNTVQFSNHTGYGQWQGDIFTRDHIKSIVHGIESLGVANRCQAILSGYMGSADICEEVYEIVARFKARNPEVIYLCDPVIGNTSCYVKPEVVTFFKNNLNADIITPNQFEAECLSGMIIRCEKDVKRVADYFHELGVKIVVITSVKFEGPDMYVFASDQNETLLIKTTEYDFDEPPSGTGDLFSALFLGAYLKDKNAFKALAFATAWTEKVMFQTFSAKSQELVITGLFYGAVAP